MREKNNPLVYGEPVILYDKRNRRTRSVSKAKSFQFKGLSNRYLKRKIPFPPGFRKKDLREFFIVEVISLYRKSVKRRRPKKKEKNLIPRSGGHFSRQLPSKGRPYRNFFKFKKNYPKWQIELDPEVFHGVLEDDILPLFRRYHKRVEKDFPRAKIKSYHGYFYIGIETPGQISGKIIRSHRTLDVIAEPDFFLRFALMRYATWWKKHNYDGTLFLNGFAAMIEFETKKPVFKTKAGIR